ncbi:class II aldolase/adducin family protein [Pelagibacterium nitratireducens]|uniref:Class II aldolase/adducin family protein n=1 Tax=Pelagibacterium nitratireducens TaxID=1046114 RepID=A0ABZ2I3V6_9HYPH
MVQTASQDVQPAGMSDTEWSARIELAAAHRLADRFGWTNLVYNHITLRVPGEDNCFLLKPNDELFNEVTASSLVKLDLEGNVQDGSRAVNVAGFNIHTAVLKARPEINCSIHVHTKAGMAISALDVDLLPLTQGSMRFYRRIAYHEYYGISDKEAERAQIAMDIGQMKVMILRNHGLLTCAPGIGEAMMSMKYLIDSCEVQLAAQASGAPLRLPPPEMCEMAAEQWDAHDKGGNVAEWNALMRMAEALDPSFKR